MDTGTKVYRNYFPIKFGWQSSCKFGLLYPVFRKLMYPGDVFKIHADLLVRYQPMLTPPMNDCTATVRFGFVPLRLIEPNTELIITGSKEGTLSTETLPVMESCFKYLDVSGTHTTVEKNSLLDLLYGIPQGLALNAPGILTKLENSKSAPAAYFAKAYHRFWFDYYRDENLDHFDDFDTFWNNNKPGLHIADYGSINTVSLKKDRITSSLPWQLKAIAAPTISVTGAASFTPNYTGLWTVLDNDGTTGNNPVHFDQESGDDAAFIYKKAAGETSTDAFNKVATTNTRIKALLNESQNITINQLGFNMAQLRELSAQTRIFERLARCGSRYTEYLRANFGVAPADDTLQRAQYIGGFKTRIVTTEVIQTAADGSNPVGTLRGHGITHGTSTIRPFMAKEIGVIIGVLDIKPETIYAQGVDRELTARSRFDFLNPSFQHLSEQEVRKGEVYFGIDTDSNGNLVNDETWGFQPYAQELRTGIKHVVGDMRDSLSYWNQALIMSSRPSLNASFIHAWSHRASYNRPFAVSNPNADPMIIDFGGIIEAYRPLVKNGTPGLTDHN